MDINNIKYMRELYMQKAKLNREQKLISEEIQNLKKSCNHVMIETNTKMKCFFCNRTIKNVSINAYQNDIFLKASLINNLDEARIEALDIILNNPEITQEQLVKKIKSRYYK